MSGDGLSIIRRERQRRYLVKRRFITNLEAALSLFDEKIQSRVFAIGPGKNFAVHVDATVDDSAHRLSPL